MKIEKPEKYSLGNVYDYRDCVKYIEAKHNIDLRNYGRDKNDFTSWLGTRTEWHNDSPFYFPVDDLEEDDNLPYWVRELIILFRDEFFTKDDEDYYQMYISW